MLHKHTFIDTGITVGIRKVSPLLLSEFQKKHPAPKPPKNKVMIGDEERYEENPSDPDYLKQVEKFQVDMELAMRRLLIRWGVVYELTDEDRQKIADLREYWKSENGEDLPGSELEVFISYIAVGTPEDLEELIQAIMRRTQPTNAATEEAADSFRG